MSRHKNAVVQMPNMQELGGHRPGIPAFVRVPIYPTAPYVSTRQDVGIQPRFYGATLASGDADYLQNSESIRIVNFDIPCVLFARAGGAFNTGAGNALPIGVSPLDTFLFRMEYSTGDKLDTGPRMASTCLGTMQNPGEVGGAGYVIQPGAGLVLGITPLLQNLRIDITLFCMEQRGPSNYTQGI